MSDEIAEAPTPPTPAPAAAFVDQAKRFRTVPLQWPVEYDGKVYDHVTVHRMTTAEVDAFVTAARELGSGTPLPMYDCPKAVIDALDPDDAAEVNKATMDFLPQMLRPDA